MISPLAVAVLAVLSVACLGAATAIADRARLLSRVGPIQVPSRTRSHGRAPITLLVVGAIVSAWFVGTALGGVAAGVACVGALAATPALVRRRRAARLDKAVQEQLPECVSVIGSGLRAGRSLAQAIELAGDELAPPLGPTLRRVADRVGLGDPLEDALQAWAIEVGGPDARLAAGVFGLQRRTGGALATALDELAVTLRSRRSAARELRSLTAQARLSATILGLLPIGFFLFLSVVARRDVEAAFGTSTGSGAVILGFTLQACAYVWIRRLLRVEP